jgi:hypothetical protein
MSRRAFDRFMVDVELASNPKIGRLTDREFRILVSGVWALAAKAEPRGYLVIAGQPATPADVAHQAHCSPAAATATLDKLRQLDMLEFDEDESLERCHDWDEVNPAPKVDQTNAERQRRYRERRNAERNALHVTDVTPPEVEVEVEAEQEESRQASPTLVEPTTTTAPVGEEEEACLPGVVVGGEEVEISDAEIVEAMAEEPPLVLTGWAARQHRGMVERAEAHALEETGVA